MPNEHLLMIVVALGAGAFVKGVTGMGLPLIAIPVLATGLGLPHAISVMTVPIIVTNAWQVWRFRGESSSPNLRFLLPMILAGACGIALGTWVLTRLDERTLSIILGSLLLGYVILRLLRPNMTLRAVSAGYVAAPTGFAAGLLQGSTGLSSPIVVTFIHTMRLSYAPHVYAVSVIFLMLSVAQFPALIVSGILRWVWLIEGVFAMLPILCFMPLGQWVGARISHTTFDRAVLTLIGLMGAKLAVDF